MSINAYVFRQLLTPLVHTEGECKIDDEFLKIAEHIQNSLKEVKDLLDEIQCLKFDKKHPFESVRKVEQLKEKASSILEEAISELVKYRESK